jgi:alkaline phosphatase
MARSQLSLVLLLIFSLALADEYHQKGNRKNAKIAYRNIDPLLKSLEGFNEYWDEKGQNNLNEQLNVQKNTKKAKNIILFVGDGLSITTTAATRAYLGGEEVQLSFEKFPHLGLAKTYCVNR